MLLLTLFYNRVRGVVLGPGLPHVLGTDELHHGAGLVGLVPAVLQAGAGVNVDVDEALGCLVPGLGEPGRPADRLGVACYAQPAQRDLYKETKSHQNNSKNKTCESSKKDKLFCCNSLIT
jgi:hypothetical protein